MVKNSSKSKLIFTRQEMTPVILVKSFWVSTALAAILSLPPVGIFMLILRHSGNIIVASIVGFGLHFLLLMISGKISSTLATLFDE